MVKDVALICNWLPCIQIQMFEAENYFDQLCLHSTGSWSLNALWDSVRTDILIFFFHSTHHFLWVDFFYKATFCSCCLHQIQFQLRVVHTLSGRASIPLHLTLHEWELEIDSSPVLYQKCHHSLTFFLQDFNLSSK